MIDSSDRRRLELELELELGLGQEEQEESCSTSLNDVPESTDEGGTVTLC